MTARKKLIVTGANGFVAGSVLTQAGAEWEVHALSRSGPSARRANLHWHTCDPLAPGQLARVFDAVRPDAVIHAAALADIDVCQAHPELARAANVEFTRVLAELCGERDCKFVLCSTDTIFDGEHAPYGEDAPPGPVNFYAETKVEAERIATRLGAHAAIARLSLVVGLPVLGAGNSFLPRMLASLKAGRAVAATEREVRTPVDVITAGRALLELAAGRHHGIFHLAGLERLNRFEIAQKIAARFGFPQELVASQSIGNAAGRAARPRDVSLLTAKTRAQLQTPLRSLEDGLSLILNPPWPARSGQDSSGQRHRSD
jgi:dTDP-4-dehydrorhamnose reductase